MTAFGNVLEVQREGTQIRVRAEQATLELDFLTPGILRVRLKFPNEIATGQQVALPLADPDLTLGIEDGDPYTVKTTAFSVQIYRDPLRLVFRDVAENVLLQMDARALGWEVCPTTTAAAGCTPDSDGQPKSTTTAWARPDLVWTKTAPRGDCGTATTAMGPGPTWPSRSS